MRNKIRWGWPGAKYFYRKPHISGKTNTKYRIKSQSLISWLNIVGGRWEPALAFLPHLYYFHIENNKCCWRCNICRVTIVWSFQTVKFSAALVRTDTPAHKREINLPRNGFTFNLKEEHSASIVCDIHLTTSTIPSLDKTFLNLSSLPSFLPSLDKCYVEV